MYRAASPSPYAAPRAVSPSPYAAPRAVSPSPYGPPQDFQNNQQQAQVPPPPGTVTYTTTTGPDGRIVYHPFKAVAASYQTPKGIVSGIQWVPAEATQILPAGAQPATSDFAASWNKGYVSKDDQKALKDWQRDEDRRRRKEEKEAARRLKEKERDRNDVDAELRRARERDAQSSAVRERRLSFNAGAPPPMAYSPSAGQTPLYPTTNPGYPQSPYTSTGVTSPITSYASGPYGRPNAGGASDLDRQFNDLDIDRRKEYGGGEKPGLGRPQKYSSSDASGGGAGERQRPVSGNFGVHSPAAGPYGSSTAGPYGAAAGPYGNPKGSNAFPPASPNMRASELAHAPSANYPGANFSSSPSRAPSPSIPPNTFASGGAQPQVYPRGHVMEGQPIGSRSRAASPNPGASPNFSASNAFPHSPRMSDAAGFPGEQTQLAAPEGFNRPINAAQPYTPFDAMKIQEMDAFLEYIPKMPLVLQPHDVFHDDWIRFMQDLSLAWAGKLPVPDLIRGGQAPKKATLAGDLIDLWNASFFLARGVEVVLYKGRERRSGPHTGVLDNIPLHGGDESSSSETTTTSESESDGGGRYPAGQGPYGGPYGRPGAADEARDARRKRREDRRKRRRERRARRKAKESAKRYSLWITCVPQGSAGGGGVMGIGMPGGFTGQQHAGSHGGQHQHAGSHGGQHQQHTGSHGGQHHHSSSHDGRHGGGGYGGNHGY